MSIAPESVHARAFAAWASRGVGADDRIEVPYVTDNWIAKRRDR